MTSKSAALGEGAHATSCPASRARPAASPAQARAPDEGAAALVRECSEIYHSSGHPCACPTDHMRNGRLCGRVSAHDRPGGASPICELAEVTPELLKKGAMLEERCHYHGR